MGGGGGRGFVPFSGASPGRGASSRLPPENTFPCKMNFKYRAFNKIQIIDPMMKCFSLNGFWVLGSDSNVTGTIFLFSN